MKIAFVILILATFALHLYIGLMHSRLYMDGIWKGTKRISMKQLKDALHTPIGSANQLKLKKLRNYYMVFLVLFWTLIFFVCLQFLIFLK
ncbi:MAG: hypothetical protein ACK4ND_17490 [Cytophagaceae bacterium]